MQLYEPWSATGLNGAELEWWLTDGKTDFDAQTFGRAELQRWIEATGTNSAYRFDGVDAESASGGEVSTASATEETDGRRTDADSGDSGPPPLTTGDIAHAFAGLYWTTEEQWKKPLGDKPKWLVACIQIPGERGVRETRWNPVFIGAALVTRGKVKTNSVRAKFQT
ncbi:MAG: hypothetical protein JSR78_09930, partial [Proteobacteria bacterium]|nr:hypothetical protein [Pseudomonadota bacterium]